MSAMKAPVSSTNQLELSKWGLPPEVLSKYAEKSITHMFKWQAECLCVPGVLSKLHMNFFMNNLFIP